MGGRFSALAMVSRIGDDPGSSDIYNFPGGYCLEETPDPIPNSAVKLKDANGTAGVTPWESRSPPGL